MSTICDPYVWENPKVLIQTNIFGKGVGACVSEQVNQVALNCILFGTIASIGLVAFNSMRTVYISILLLLLLVFQPMYSILIMARAREGFSDSKSSGRIRNALPDVDVIGKNNQGIHSALTAPTSRNPFMNVLVDEVKYRPTRAPAKSVMDPSVKITLNDFFKTEFNRDPTDVFGRNQSQRQFITMPSTGIPNDVDSYQKWLYKIPGKTCKEGNGAACLPGTDGGALPWLNADS
jgi:hypothetical protein